MTALIETKFGKANINNNGYYVIVSSKEGNFQKLLHRLIIEDFYNICLPDDWVVHHDDGNKTNNEIWNLIPMPRSEHSHMHNVGRECVWKGRHLPKQMRENISKSLKGRVFTEEWKKNISKSKKGHIVSEETKRKFRIINAGKNNGMYGKKHLIESRMKMSKSRKNVPLSLNHKIQLSKSTNSSGFYRVSKKKDNSCTQGFMWIYSYRRDDGSVHYFSSVNLLKLKQKVITNNYHWELLNEKNALNSMKEGNIPLSELNNLK